MKKQAISENNIKTFRDKLQGNRNQIEMIKKNGIDNKNDLNLKIRNYNDMKNEYQFLKNELPAGDDDDVRKAIMSIFGEQSLGITSPWSFCTLNQKEWEEMINLMEGNTVIQKQHARKIISKICQWMNHPYCRNQQIQTRAVGKYKQSPGMKGCDEQKRGTLSKMIPFRKRLKP